MCNITRSYLWEESDAVVSGIASIHVKQEFLMKTHIPYGKQYLRFVLLSINALKKYATVTTSSAAN